MAKCDSREGEKGEADDVKDEGGNDAVGVGCAGLQVSEEAHGDEVCEGRHRNYGGGEVSEEPWGAGEAVGEVGEGGEEHVPGG